ncbi:hypothetical protein JOM56_002683 [Amanita muscaria]
MPVTRALRSCCTSPFPSHWPSSSLFSWCGVVLISHQELSIFQLYVGLVNTTFQTSNAFMYILDILPSGLSRTSLCCFDFVPETDAESEKAIYIRIDRVHFRHSTRPAGRVLRPLSNFLSASMILFWGRYVSR